MSKVIKYQGTTNYKKLECTNLNTRLEKLQGQ